MSEKKRNITSMWVARIATRKRSSLRKKEMTVQKPWRTTKRGCLHGKSDGFETIVLREHAGRRDIDASHWRGGVSRSAEGRSLPVAG